MVHWTLRGALTVSGIALLIGFFLPWIDIGDVANINGFELVSGPNLPVWQRYMLAVCPIVGLALVGSGVVGFKGARWVGVGAGSIVLLYGIFTVGYIVFHMLDAGLWIVLAGALVALVSGLVLKPKRLPPKASQPQAIEATKETVEVGGTDQEEQEEVPIGEAKA